MAKTKLNFSRGLEKELPTKYSDGEIRFCTDTGALFIDNATGRTKIAAGKADKADKLTAERVITLAGDVTGSVSFDGSKAVTITTTVKDDSHSHTYLKGNTDNRAVATTPDDYNSVFKIAGLKTNSYIGSPSTDDYSGVIGFR
jgi:hypothetical protein